MQTTVLNVSGVYNSNSATTIRNAINSIQGVTNVSIDVNTSKITVTFDPASTDLSTIKSAISNTGVYIH